METNLAHVPEEPAGSFINGVEEASHIVEIQDPPPRSNVPTRDRWFKHIARREEPSKQGKGKIYKVPNQLQANKDCIDYYKPKAVSLGPYHFGDGNLTEIQRLKTSMAERFVPDEALATFMRSEIKENITKLMDAYCVEKVKTLEPSKWAEMLFLDGCYVLHFICCIMYNRLEDLEINRLQIDSVHNDLFLLENQLPFQLLKILSGNDPNLLQWVDQYIHTHKISYDIYYYSGRDDEPVHLLDRLRSIIISSGRSETPKRGQAIRKIFETKSWRQGSLQSTPQTRTKNTVIRNAKELTTRGIYFKPNRTGLLKDIFFRSHFIYGTLRLPRIIVDDSTRLLFSNLAAYEMCVDVGSTIISYICLMDSLVNHADDIKELQAAGILVNHLATDEKAANLFNEMSQGLRPDTDAYMDVKTKMQKFFQNKTKASLARWIAEGYHNHFKSPLTAMAVLAASIALGLAATQTYFNIFPRGNK